MRLARATARRSTATSRSRPASSNAAGATATVSLRPSASSCCALRVARPISVPSASSAARDLQRIVLALRVVGLHLQGGQVGAQLVRGIVEELALLRHRVLRARHLVVDRGHQRPHFGGQVGVGDAREVVGLARFDLARRGATAAAAPAASAAPVPNTSSASTSASRSAALRTKRVRELLARARCSRRPRISTLRPALRHGGRAVELAPVGREPRRFAEVRRRRRKPARRARGRLSGRRGQVGAAEFDQPVGGARPRKNTRPLAVSSKNSNMV